MKNRLLAKDVAPRVIIALSASIGTAAMTGCTYMEGVKSTETTLDTVAIPNPKIITLEALIEKGCDGNKYETSGFATLLEHTSRHKSYPSFNPATKSMNIVISEVEEITYDIRATESPAAPSITAYQEEGGDYTPLPVPVLGSSTELYSEKVFLSGTYDPNGETGCLFNIESINPIS